MFYHKNIAVTGASGFLGRVVLRKLIQKGYRVTVLDSSGSTYPEGVQVVSGNLFKKTDYSKLTANSTVLIHLAGQIEQGKTTMLQGNTDTTRNLLRSLSKSPIKKIIFASSVAVYGSSQTKIFDESATCKPDTEYGKSKLRAEKLIVNWSSRNDKKYAILRFFSLYGYENRKGFVYKLFMHLFDSSEVLITGDGKQERDLVWVEDAADAIILALKRNVSGVYNIGTGKNYSLLRIIDLMEKIANKKCHIKFVMGDKEKVANIYYRSEKIRKAGWRPKILPEKGLILLFNEVFKPMSS